MKLIRLIILLFSLHFGVSSHAMDTLRFSIDSTEFAQLLSMRNSAFEKGLIEKSEKKKIKVRLAFANKELEAKLRLKGDWTDHLDSDKWSFRVQLKNGHFRGMRKFS